MYSILKHLWWVKDWYWRSKTRVGMRWGRGITSLWSYFSDSNRGINQSTDRLALLDAFIHLLGLMHGTLPCESDKSIKPFVRLWAFRMWLQRSLVQRSVGRGGSFEGMMPIPFLYPKSLAAIETRKTVLLKNTSEVFDLKPTRELWWIEINGFPSQ